MMLSVNTQVLLKKVLTPVNTPKIQVQERTKDVPAPILVKVVSINLVPAVQILSAVQHILVNLLVTLILRKAQDA
jgi:hypothetical protein